MNKAIATLMILTIALLPQLGLADFYSENAIQAPQEGDVVCQAYVSEFATLRLSAQVPCQNGCQRVVLPKKFCSTHKSLESWRFSHLFNWGGKRMRVVAVGDFYTLKDENQSSNEAKVINPQFAKEVCQARAFDQQGRVVVLNKLEKDQCFAGAQFPIRFQGKTKVVRVEMVDNFHYVPAAQAQYAEVNKSQNRNRKTQNSFKAVYYVEL